MLTLRDVEESMADSSLKPLALLKFASLISWPPAGVMETDWLPELAGKVNDNAALVAPAGAVNSAVYAETVLRTGGSLMASTCLLPMTLNFLLSKVYSKPTSMCVKSRLTETQAAT